MSGLRVLIADDDAVVRTIVAQVVKGRGLEPVIAADGWEAWKEFDRLPARIVISDWAMPEIDGIQLCRKIRERERTEYAWFIMLTSKGEREDALVALDSGADDFLPKPVDAKLLDARLRVAERVLKLESQVQQLEGILPICSDCKKIRKEDGAYERIENFVEKRSGARFSHTFCPDCLARRGYVKK